MSKKTNKFFLIFQNKITCCQFPVIQLDSVKLVCRAAPLFSLMDTFILRSSSVVVLVVVVSLVVVVGLVVVVVATVVVVVVGLMVVVVVATVVVVVVVRGGHSRRRQVAVRLAFQFFGFFSLLHRLLRTW